MRSRLLISSCLALVTGLVFHWTSRAQDSNDAYPNPNSAIQVDLLTQLEKGLKARLPSDFAFLQRVVSQVNAGTVPLRLVNQSFLYARRLDKKWQVFYFRRVLKNLMYREGLDTSVLHVPNTPS